MKMKASTKSTVTALAVGGGLVTIIAAIEARRARVAAPVITHGGRGRWSAPYRVGTISEYPTTLLEEIRRVLDEYERIAVAEKAKEAKERHP